MGIDALLILIFLLWFLVEEGGKTPFKPFFPFKFLNRTSLTIEEYLEREKGVSSQVSVVKNMSSISLEKDLD